MGNSSVAASGDAGLLGAPLLDRLPGAASRYRPCIPASEAEDHSSPLPSLHHPTSRLGAVVVAVIQKADTLRREGWRIAAQAPHPPVWNGEACTSGRRPWAVRDGERNILKGMSAQIRVARGGTTG